jgi:deazaflavin-dependent oxidoreductase (nitroreductase family)
MTMPDWNQEIHDSPTGWVADHIRRYVETDGESGQRWQGTDTLLLTTVGRRTGKLRRTALIYGQDADRYIIVGSKGGSHHHPQWYLNLLETPEVHLQDGAQKWFATARPATDEERPRLWALMSSIFPQYDVYQQKTERKIPLVILEPERAEETT